MTSRLWYRLGVPPTLQPVLRAGLVLGIGLGGFVDGILLHQVLQWHHVLSAYDDPAVATDLPLNVLADGLFHVLTYAFTVAGVLLLVRAWRRPGIPPARRALLGAGLAGWGVFNLVEGVIDHHLLGIHHVWPAGPGSVLLWDLAYLALGALLVVFGAGLVRTDPQMVADGPP